MDNKGKFSIDWILFLTAFVAVLLYLPFIPRTFMGDDWLWLSNAKKALSDPAIFFQRPMYGYLRPLNMFVVSIMFKIFGASPFIFGLGNILLHAANIFLLSEALKRFQIEDRIRYLSALIFAFYYLNAPVITWIATGHDIWVTFLSLLFVIQIFKVYQKPNLGGFLLAWALAFSAVLFKESGFVTIGLYFIIAFFLKRSPFSGKFRLYTVIFISTFLAYLAYYALTRTYADKQLVFGAATLLNLWYFLVYMFLPLSKRIADALPSGLLSILVTLKIFLTASILVLSYVILRRGPAAVKFFLLWPVMFISTIAIMKWNVSLFSLYPPDTAGRFFYTANIGASVILAWLVSLILGKIRLKLFSRRFILAAAAFVFIAMNMAIIFKTNRIYSHRQIVVGNLLNDFKSISDSFADNDTLVILVDRINDPPEEIIESAVHLQAIVFIELAKTIQVEVAEQNGFMKGEPSMTGRRKIIGWNERDSHLVIPSITQNKTL